MPLIGSIDQGTQSTRFTLFDSALEVKGFAVANHEQKYPKPGWCDHDPREILDNTISLMKQVWTQYCEDCKNLKQMPEDLAGIGITNQRETVVVWNKYTGAPLCDAVVWFDIRSSEISNSYIKEYGGINSFQKLTGLPINTYFSAFKVQWLMENDPKVATAMRHNYAYIGNINTWLIWNLTGGPDGGAFVTDVTNASRMFLMDINTLQWSPKLLKIFKIPTEALPTILTCSEFYGRVKCAEIPELSGVTICGCAGDQQAACLGHGLFVPGAVKCTFGTGAFLIINTGSDGPVFSNCGLLTTPCYQFKGEAAVWSLEGSIAIAGGGVSWLRDNLGLIKDAAETEDLANEAKDTEGVVFVPAFSGLYAPYWEFSARASLFGLTLKHNRSHIVRAVLEGISFSVHDVLVAMAKDMGLKGGIPAIKADGGMVANAAFCQMNADIMDTVIECPADLQVTSLGAAIAAGIGCGMFDLSTVKEILGKRVIALWTPCMDSAHREKKMKQWNCAVKRSMEWESLL